MRPEYRIWDKEKNEYYKPTYKAYAGELEDLTISPSGELVMRTLAHPAKHESIFPERFEVEQFSGCTDKTQTKVFVGDIYKNTFGRVFEIKVSEKESGIIGFRIANGKPKESPLLHTNWKLEGEVIGNIHQHAHLLEDAT